MFSKLVKDHAPPYNSEINGHTYTKGHYLADIIYPRSTAFVKTIFEPLDQRKSRLAERQESCTKDIDRVFCVLQSRFAIVRYPVLTWSQDQM
jgi:hypothetical protein